MELLKEEFTKVTQIFWWEIFTLPFVVAYQFYFYMCQPIGLHFLKRFIFELKAFSYSFKITCILLRQIISPMKMVMSSAKFTNLISWSPICTPLILLSASMKLASTSAALVYNTDESGHPWRTPCIRVKGSDRRPFIVILDWMLVYATLIVRMNFSPYPAFCKTEKAISQPTRPKALRILQRGFYSVYLTHQWHHK